MKKHFYTILASLLFLASCTVDEEAWLSIQNDSGHVIIIDFIPAEGASGYKIQESVSEDPNSQVDIYYSDIIDIDPAELLSAGYDSMIVQIAGPEKDTIFFGKNSTPNYSINPFEDTDQWQYEVFERIFPARFTNKTKRIHNYFLVIDGEKIE